MRVLILKPKVDTKGSGDLVSRLGVRRPADLLVPPDMDLVEAVRAASGHELLTMEAHCAVAALAGMEPDGGDVDKIGLCCHTGPPVFSSKRAGPRGSGSLCCRF